MKNIIRIIDSNCFLLVHYYSFIATLSSTFILKKYTPLGKLETSIIFVPITMVNTFIALSALPLD